MQEVIRLHEHIVELEERKSLLHPRLIALCGKHLVYGEVYAYLAHKVYIVETVQPIGVVDHDGCVVAFEVEELGHLLLKALAVVIDYLVGHHLTHVRLARRIAYLACAAADENNWLVSRLLHMAHDHQLDKVPHMQAVCRRVESYIERHALLRQQLI